MARQENVDRVITAIREAYAADPHATSSDVIARAEVSSATYYRIVGNDPRAQLALVEASRVALKEVGSDSDRLKAAEEELAELTSIIVRLSVAISQKDRTIADLRRRLGNVSPIRST